MVDALDDDYWEEAASNIEEDEEADESDKPDKLESDSDSDDSQPDKGKYLRVTKPAEQQPAKKKKKRKRITDEPAEKLLKAADYEDYKQLVHKHFPDLSGVEYEDLTPEKEHFLAANEKLLSIDEYIEKNHIKLGKLKASCIAGSPPVLIICGSAIRCADVNRQLMTIRTSQQIGIALLFAKHKKAEEQAEFLRKKNNVIAMGTPARVKALFDRGALQVDGLRYVILDWNFRDIKKRRMVDMRELVRDLFALLKEHIVAKVSTNPIKIGLL